MSRNICVHVFLSIPLTICNASLSLIDFEKKVGFFSSLYKLYEKRQLGIGKRHYQCPPEHLRKKSSLVRS